MSLGGNDALVRMGLRVPIDRIIENFLNDTQQFLDPLFESNSEIVVVAFGYEQLEWGSPGCGAMGRVIFHECSGLNNDPDYISCVNTIQMSLQEATDQLAALYPRFYSVNLYGSMQADAGVNGASVGNPVLTEWVDQSYMNDCIHPNNSGYRVVFDALWNEFFNKMV
jgi:hypothetical protein